MAREIAYRLGILVVLLWIVSLVVFMLTALIPGDPAAAMLGDGATPEQLEAVRDSLGLNDPLIVRYVVWLGGVLSGDLGVSLISSQTVSEAIGSRLAVTASLVGGSLLVSLVLGTVLGTIAAVRPGSLVDRAILVLSSVGIAVPTFWLGVLLVSAAATMGGAFPTGGYVDFGESPSLWLQHLILPVIALAAGGVAEIARQTRASVIDTSRLEFVTTLRAKGMAPSNILLKHTLRSAMVPVVTVTGLQVNRLFGLSVLVEIIFGLPGVGSLLVNAVFSRDVIMVQGIVLLITFVVVVVNLFVDVSYRFFNPRGAQ